MLGFGVGGRACRGRTGPARAPSLPRPDGRRMRATQPRPFAPARRFADFVGFGQNVGPEPRAAPRRPMGRRASGGSCRRLLVPPPLPCLDKWRKRAGAPFGGLARLRPSRRSCGMRAKGRTSGAARVFWGGAVSAPSGQLNMNAPIIGILSSCIAAKPKRDRLIFGSTTDRSSASKAERGWTDATGRALLPPWV